MGGSPDRTRFWDRRYAGAVVVAIAVALYLPTLAFNRVQLDDMWLWSDDSPLRHLDAAVLHDVAFELDSRARHPYGTEYLPVRDLVVAGDMAAWGDDDRGPHATQLALFALTVLALGTLLVRFGVAPAVAWLGTLVWAIHPMHVETVCWLSERKGVLCGLCVLACGHAWLRYRRGGSAAWLCAATVAAIAGVWSKAPAMFGAAVFAALDVVLLPRGRRRWIAIAVVGGATVLAAIPVVLVAARAGVIEPAAGSRFGNALGSLGHYVASLVLARAPAISYPIVTDGPSAVDLALGAAWLAASIAALWWLRRSRLALALLAWTWIWFLPVSHLIAPVHIIVADRYVYLWAIGPCVAAAWAIERLPSLARLAVAGALVCVLGIATIRAEQAWTSSVELFERGVAANPRDPKAIENLAIALAADGNPTGALAVLARGLAELPDEPYLLDREALILFGLHRPDEALAAAARAAEAGLGSTMWTYADLLESVGRPSDALPWAERAARRHPENAAYARTLARLQGRGPLPQQSGDALHDPHSRVRER